MWRTRDDGPSNFEQKRSSSDRKDPGPPSAQATASDTDKFARWHRGMLQRGVYLAPSQYEAGFMSLAHTDADIEKTIAAAKEVFAEI